MNRYLLYLILFFVSCGSARSNLVNTYLSQCSSITASAENVVKNCTFALKDASLSDFVRAQVFLTRGIVHAKEGRYLVAIRDYNLAEQADPTLYEIFPNKAQAYLKLKKFDKAIEMYTFSLERNPDDSISWAERGSVSLLQNELDKAVKDFEVALRLDPKLDVALYNGALANARLGNHAQAIRWLSQTIIHNPQDATAYLQRGKSFQAMQQYQRAQEDYSIAIKLSPEIAEVWLLRGQLYDGINRPELAEQDYRRAYELGAQSETLLQRLQK